MGHLQEENILSEMLSTLRLLVSHFLSPHIVFMIQPSEPIQSCGLYQASPLLSAAGFPITHQFPHPNFFFPLTVTWSSYIFQDFPDFSTVHCSIKLESCPNEQ